MSNTDQKIVSLTANSLDPQGFAQAVHEHHFKIRDFVADPRDIMLATDQGGSLLSMRDVTGDSGDQLQLPVNDWAHAQLADFCSIPRAYYERMRAEQQATRPWHGKRRGPPAKRRLATVKRARRQLLVGGLTIFALWYAWTWLQVALSAQALQHEYDVYDAPGVHDGTQRNPE